MLITIDYMHDNREYRRALNAALEEIPNEAFGKFKPNVARNRSAIIDTFESTTFSSFMQLMPVEYRNQFNKLEPSHKNMQGFRRQIWDHDNNVNGILDRMEEEGFAQEQSPDFDITYFTFSDDDDNDIMDLFIDNDF